uniref:tyrosine-type recombinase/integrase n=1 Tax=Deinococcus sp. TaxID=47478 RepID=UPI0025E5B18B
DRVHTSVCERAGVRRLNIHALRHTFGSLMAAQGERIEYISKLMGHADPAFTLRQYRHLYPDELQSIFLKLPPTNDAE